MREALDDVKLLAAGAGIGALLCARLVPDSAAHVCGLAAAIFAAITFGIHKGTER